MTSVPYGTCHCGCGEKTRLAPYTDATKGWRKGEPQRFIKDHCVQHLYPTLKPVKYETRDCGYDTECWVWLLGLDRHGYGRTTVDGLPHGAHKVYWERENGPVPEGLQLDHLCRVRACCNPAHMEPVTNAENSQRGARAKLTVTDVREIRASSESNSALAERFGVRPPTISRIRSRLRWKNV